MSKLTLYFNYIHSYITNGHRLSKYLWSYERMLAAFMVIRMSRPRPRYKMVKKTIDVPNLKTL